MTGMVKHSTSTHTRTEYVNAEYEYECDYLCFQWSEYGRGGGVGGVCVCGLCVCVRGRGGRSVFMEPIVVHEIMPRDWCQELFETP